SHLSSADATNILDVNGNGTLNFGDLQYLLNLINSGGGSLAESSAASSPASPPAPTLNPGSSDSLSVTNSVTFSVSPTTSTVASPKKTVTSAGSNSSSALTKTIALATVDHVFDRFDLRSFAKRAAHKQAAHNAQQDSLTDALLTGNGFTA